MKEEKKTELEHKIRHLNTVLSIMYEVLDSNMLEAIKINMLKAVIDVEFWKKISPMKKELLLDVFWRKDFSK